jgi:hypothetical protein
MPFTHLLKRLPFLADKSLKNFHRYLHRFRMNEQPLDYCSDDEERQYER